MSHRESCRNKHLDWLLSESNEGMVLGSPEFFYVSSWVVKLVWNSDVFTPQIRCIGACCCKSWFFLNVSWKSLEQNTTTTEENSSESKEFSCWKLHHPHSEDPCSGVEIARQEHFASFQFPGNPRESKKKYTSIKSKQPFLLAWLFWLQRMSPASNLIGNQMETGHQIMVDLDLCARGLERGQREPKGDKPRNHDATGSSRREEKGDKPRNHDETDPVERRQRETSHDGTESTRKETSKPWRNCIQ